MHIEAELKQPEIAQLLKTYGFEGLRLVDHKDKTSTYKFKDFDKKFLDNTFGSPAVTSNGKVAVYSIPAVGKIGVSPSNSMVRLKDETSGDRAGSATHHLANVKVPPAYEKAYLQAQVNPSVRVKFCQKLFEYFNTDRFDSKLETPKFSVSEKNPPGTKKTTRGAHTGGRNFAPGTVWMASFMFNARSVFFYEVFLHELCHLAAWNITKSADFSHNGHGPTWQMWMKKVGLDARRFDPTDDTEYQIGPEKYAKEAERSEKYGSPATEQELAQFERYKGYTGAKLENAYLITDGRIFFGDAYEKEFVGRSNSNGKMFSWKFKTVKSLANYLYRKK